MIRRSICMLTGHTSVLVFEPRRLALRCLQCGYESPGWSIGDLKPSHAIDSKREMSTARDRAA